MRKSLIALAALSALSSFAYAGISRTAIFLRGVRDGGSFGFTATSSRRGNKMRKNNIRTAHKKISVRPQTMRKK